MLRADIFFYIMRYSEDKMHEECGVFGIFGLSTAATEAVLALRALQHRGQEAAGVVSFDAATGFHAHKGSGLVSEVFADTTILTRLVGACAIGHNRYSTAGNNSDPSSALKNIQPFTVVMAQGGFSVAHNGNLVNTDALRKKLIDRGAIFQSTSDTEIIIQLMAQGRQSSLLLRLIDALNKVQGAYSVVALTKDELIGVRDPHGFRPLVLGKLKEAYVLASETCALDLIGAQYIRDIEPGEVVVISSEGVKSLKPFKSQKRHFCLFEYVYFARPDSSVDQKSVYVVRQQIGRRLARECPVEADVVVPVLDSGTPAAMGYSAELGIPFEFGLIRSHYIGRTFIAPGTNARNFGVRLKLSVNKAVVVGKRVVLVDDSLVRGTTSKKTVNILYEAGAKEVHLRLSSPMVKNPCHFGIDTPEKTQLIASSKTLEEIRDFLCVDSVGFISIEGLEEAVGRESEENCGFCNACFTGNYPVTIKNA